MNSEHFGKALSGRAGAILLHWFCKVIRLDAVMMC